jgi:hypothetical protein
LAERELSDEEIAMHGDEDELVLLAVGDERPETVVVVVVDGVELLIGMEDEGLPDAIAWLEARGLDYSIAPKPRAQEERKRSTPPKAKRPKRPKRSKR